MPDTAHATARDDRHQPQRRKFLYLATGAVAATGGAAAVWPLIDSLNPNADDIARLPVEYDLNSIQPGQRITVKWRIWNVFIARRTPEEIAKARAEDHTKLKDPEPDDARVQRAEWLIVMGNCTYDGCDLSGQAPGDHRGDFGGWFCRCYASHYDTSGRARKGPAPRNLVVPSYRFLDDTTLEISWRDRNGSTT